MATYNKINIFTEDLCQGVHQLHAAGHTLKVYLTNGTPSATADLVKADLAEITPENGYSAGGPDIENDLAFNAGTTTLTAVDKTITASTGTIGPFSHVVLYNDTPNSSPHIDPLIAWWSYGSELTLQDAESFTVDWQDGEVFDLV